MFGGSLNGRHGLRHLSRPFTGSDRAFARRFDSQNLSDKSVQLPHVASLRPTIEMRPFRAVVPTDCEAV
jgi:hypothetical protein